MRGWLILSLGLAALGITWPAWAGFLDNPDVAETYADRGAADNARGDYESAIADFDTAIQLNPENATAYAGRGAA